jgi:endogenous inhibitor of DNA gyrase (YacG/DUF329 family)
MPAKIKCPTCHQEVTWENNPNRPFCSKRCQLIDLGAWVTEKYRVPGRKMEQAPDEQDEEDKDN